MNNYCISHKIGQMWEFVLFCNFFVDQFGYLRQTLRCQVIHTEEQLLREVDMLDLQRALAFANEVADFAGEIARRHFRSEVEIEHKSDDSPVTVADRSIESYLRGEIEQAFPDHGIFGEEHGVQNLDRRFVWVVDPIDGTKSFVTGHPLFGSLMALLDNGEPQLGQIDMPILGERWCGVKGSPTTMNHVSVSTSDCKEVSEAYAYTTDPMLFTSEKESIFNMLRDQVRLLRFGGDCYNYALLASGHCDLVLETGLEPYDYLPVVQIVRGAGGVITDWSGAPLSIGSSGDVLASSTPELHAQVLREIQQLRAKQAA